MRMESYAASTQISELTLPVSAASPDYSYAELLERSRRLDWRFLMPVPDLGYVAYLGDAQANLIQSLKVFSQSLTCFNAGPDNLFQLGVENKFDVVVIKNPSPAAVQQANNLLKPGGYLYLEAFGWLNPGRVRNLVSRRKGSSPRSVSHPGCIQMLQGGGFTVENTHWHWPNFETCTRMIPLDHPNTLLFALASGTGIQTLLRKAVARGWVSPARLASFVPCFSILARKEGK